MTRGYREYGDLEIIVIDVVTDTLVVVDITRAGTLRAVVLNPDCIIYLRPSPRDFDLTGLG